MATLTAHWRCDDVDLGQMPDAQGATPLAVSGSAPLIPGKLGTARSFAPGASFFEAPNYASGPAPAGLATGAFSICAWLRPAHSPQFLLGTVFALSASPGGSASANVRFYYRLADVRLSWYFSTGGPGGVAFESELACPVVLTGGQWAHLATTYAGVGDPALYVNGQLVVGTVTTTIAGGTTETSWRRPSAFPAWDIWLGGFEGYWPADGALDDVRIYSSTLTTQEVAAIARAAIARAGRVTNRVATTAVVEGPRHLGATNRGAASVAIEAPRHPSLTNRGADTWRDDG